MEFVLGNQLANKLAEYDPALKLFVKQNNSKPDNTQKNYKLGIIPDLIPLHIIDQQRQLYAINHINTQPAPDRFWVFNDDPCLENLSIKACLYYWQSRWCAVWFPNQDEDYIYGITLAFRDTDSKRSKLSTIEWDSNLHSRDIIIRHKNVISRTCKIKKAEYFIQTLYVTKDMLKNKDNEFVVDWMLPGIKRSNHTSKQNIWTKALSRFEKSIRTKYGSWKHDADVFTRLIKSAGHNFLKIGTVGFYLHNKQHKNEYDFTEQNDQWLPNAVDILTLLKVHPTKYSEKTIQILDTPYFRKWIQNECDQYVIKYGDYSLDDKRIVDYHYHRIIRLVEVIENISSIWPDVTPECFQANLQQLITHTNCLKYLQEPAKKWIAVNMQPSTYLHLINKHYEDHFNSDKNTEDNELPYPRRNTVDSYTLLPVVHNTDLSDTFSMISTILEAGIILDRPKRWRLSEFHDHVSKIAWKVKNKNVLLPQDLFPEPIKIEYNNIKWTLFQPKDTHELASWGRSVRNCVGNSKNYSQSILDKKAFIVLVMLNNIPKFTIQLCINDGKIRVDQIKSIHNKSLTKQEDEMYIEVFQRALIQRNEQLH